MNAEELYLKDGRPTGVWYCGKCQFTAKGHDAAEQCCKPRICACGAECTRSWTICSTCRDAKERRRIAELAEKATKIPAREWDGPVVPEGTDGFSSLDDAIDYFECDGQEVPRPIWGTRPNKMRLDADWLIENALDEIYEGAESHIDPKAVEKLQQVLDDWAKEHGPPEGWVEDNSIVVVLDD